MTNKGKKRTSIPSHHHPSQSSIAVSLLVKKEVKALQGFKCWLCDTKASQRSLQIAHVYPQALSSRYSFAGVHQSGQTQLAYIHDKANLVGLCEICHHAFDGGQWTFLPFEMEAWISELKADPKMIRTYNSRRDIVFQRMLLRPDPNSKAFQDEAFRSAFVRNPHKVWQGEVGVVLLRNSFILMETRSRMELEVREALNRYHELQGIWINTQNPCSLKDCFLCENEENQIDGNEQQKDKNNDDDVDSDSDNNNLGPNNDENSNGKKRPPKNKKHPKSKKHHKNNNRSSAKDRQDVRRSKSIQQQTQGTYFTTRPVKHLIRGRKRVKRRVKKRAVERNKGDDWMCTTPYDESIPYSHRYGYTWANTTSNELMAMWQLYRQPVQQPCH